MDVTESRLNSEQILILLDDDFNHRNVCIVTGASGGIGRATAVAAAANNLLVVGLDINEDEGKKTKEMAKGMGGQMVFLPTDISKDQDLKRAVTKAAKLGAIKFLANVAGIHHSSSVENFPVDEYDLMQKIMLRAPFLLSKLCIPHMKKSVSGKGVIGMSSVPGDISTMNKPVYNITKVGLRALSRAISAEGKGKIRSFSVSAGFIKTGLALKQIPGQAEHRENSPEAVLKDVVKGKSRVNEMMAPIEVANLFIFGFSRYARYLVTGDLLFEGGMVLTH